MRWKKCGSIDAKHCARELIVCTSPSACVCVRLCWWQVLTIDSTSHSRFSKMSAHEFHYNRKMRIWRGKCCEWHFDQPNCIRIHRTDI